jgi:hypothetical protein
MKKLMGLFMCWVACASAQSPEDVPARIDRERAELAAQKQLILDTFEERTRACWQKFMVNNCIIAARRLRRADIEPIRQAELALNEQERQWRTEQRDERLRNKQVESTDKP